jgi:hypothetical protein
VSGARGCSSASADAAAHGDLPRRSALLDAWIFVLQTLVTIALGLTLRAERAGGWLGMIPAVLVGVACFAGRLRNHLPDPLAEGARPSSA